MNSLQYLLYESIADLPIKERALKFASFIHRRQLRKYETDDIGNKLPYIVHPKSVSNILMKWGKNDTIQAIGILHDTVEDGKFPAMTKKLINKYFGSKILRSILYLTHDKSDSYNDYILDLSKQNKLAFIVKMADMTSNLQTSPSKKQIIKYANGIKFLIDNGVRPIPSNLKAIAKKYSTK